jgi:D-beta-D-heptose 7-phosphate kinase/D-beta-D-heptose 1-phosphate adenosyltransferase
MLNSGRNKIVGFTNGCFDILHVGHIRLFEFIKKDCDHLIVAIDSDERVGKLKGPSRPLNNQSDREYMLQNISAIDETFIFNSEKELRDLIKKINPDLMVVGADYRDREVVGSEHAKELRFFERIDGYSTTKIIESSAAG